MEEDDDDLKDLKSLHTLPNCAYSIFNFCVPLDSDSPHWSILNWPFVEVSEDIRSTLLQKGSYDVQPLAAYTANETLIAPGDYIHELSGSVRIISFHVKYALPWTDSKQELIVHTTELVQVRVFAKASQFLAKNPKKRLPPAKPLFGSSSKKCLL